MNQSNRILDLSIPLLGDDCALAEILILVEKFLEIGNPTACYSHSRQKVFVFDDLAITMDSVQIVKINKGLNYSHSYTWEYRDPMFSNMSERVMIECVGGDQTGVRVFRPLPTSGDAVASLVALESELRAIWREEQ